MNGTGFLGKLTKKRQVDLMHFLAYKKAASSRWQSSPIATFKYTPAMKNGEVDLMQFPSI